ncbi:hypothetical protein N752_17645 [Desulforamulus aquiferis]|nr:hypothetical protein N752_17645 [Desulforamulus aquiferis]
MVKVNIVMIPGINDSHIPEVVRKVKELGAFITNIMPLIPADGSVFAEFPQTSKKELDKMRDLCQVDLQQMRHCKQCRADAIGLLGDDRSLEFSCKEKKEPVMRAAEGKKTYKIAIASRHGELIDLHFGQTSEFAIYEGNGKQFRCIEKRSVISYCSGTENCDDEESRRDSIINSIKDCDAVVSLRIGHKPKEKLSQKGILVVETYDTVENGLYYAVKKLSSQMAV